MEEHFQAPNAHGRTKSRFAGVEPMAWVEEMNAGLDDIGPKRLDDMDAGGVDVQVLSHHGGIEQLAPREAVPMAREANDYLASAIDRHRGRFAGFAALPMTDPGAAAAELERTVQKLGFKGALINGHSQGQFLDSQRFWPIFEVAERLGVPIYLHPAEPPDPVYAAYYEDLPDGKAQILSTAAWGWHVDTGMHALRLIVSGVFDVFPKLQVILGHMGEALPFFVARADRKLAHFGLSRTLIETLEENFYFTTSGMFTYQPLLCLLLVVGADRVMFAVDYPLSASSEGSDFLRHAPISKIDLEKIAHANAENLLQIAPA